MEQSKISEISLKTVRLDMLVEETGASLGSATGFLCRFKGKYFLVTNWHVVTGRRPDTGEAIHKSLACPQSLVIHGSFIEDYAGDNSFTGVSHYQEPFSIYESEGQIGPHWTEHPLYGKLVDVVAFELSSSIDSKLISHCFHIERELERAEKLEVMNSVYIVGFPLKREKAQNSFPIFKGGTVASEPDFHDNEPRYYVDGKTKKGMSGAPVLHRHKMKIEQKDGSIIFNQGASSLCGVYSGRDRQEKTEFEAELGIVWPMRECLVPILESILTVTADK